MGIGEVIRGSLSAEVGSLLIGVVSHAGSPRPESPQRLGSIAHIGHVEEGPMRATSACEASLYVAQPLLPHPKADTADSTRRSPIHSQHFTTQLHALNMRNMCVAASSCHPVQKSRLHVLSCRLRQHRCWSGPPLRRPGSGR